MYGGGGGLPAAGSKPGGYVPPSLKNRSATDQGDSMRRREENSLRVTNLSEDTREDDLRVCHSHNRLLSMYPATGCIERIFIPAGAILALWHHLPHLHRVRQGNRREPRLWLRQFHIQVRL